MTAVARALGGRGPLVALAAAAAAACATPPPRYPFPSAGAAIARMRATYACSRGARGESKVDYFGEGGLVRASTWFVTSRPDRLRFDVVSPFGISVSTVTSDGRTLSLLDVPGKQFVYGPASECNFTRFLRVPVPPHALTAMLSGEAPVLIHRPEDASIEWSSGAFRLTIPSRHGAVEEIRLEPAPADRDEPWQEQRVRVLDVRVVQKGVELYHAELDRFGPARTAPPREDPDGIDPPVPPSGPPCSAEVPRRIRITSEASGDDVVLVHEEYAHNPPLVPGLFQQVPPPGVKVRPALCGLR